jgi:hypothetical protein
MGLISFIKAPNEPAALPIGLPYLVCETEADSSGKDIVVPSEVFANLSMPGFSILVNFKAGNTAAYDIDDPLWGYFINQETQEGITIPIIPADSGEHGVYGPEITSWPSRSVLLLTNVDGYFIENHFTDTKQQIQIVTWEADD